MWFLGKTMISVYITAKIPKEGIELLKKKGFQVEVNNSDKNLSARELKEIFSKFDAVLTLMTDKIDEETLAAASGRLKIIANYATGFDNIDVLAAKRRGVVVTNTPVSGQAVAEHAFSLILACAKRIVEADRFVRTGKFTRWDPMAFLSGQVAGQTIGIIGLGRIGASVGRIAYDGFGMKILYHDIDRFQDFELLTDAKLVSLFELLSVADVITLSVPLTFSTRHLIGKRELELMKNSAILINVSRGVVVDEAALIWALSTKKIAAAGLDVFENEPNIPHELLTLSNVVFTPHIASATFETRISMAKIAAQNIIDVFEGKTPFGIIKVS